MGIQTLLLIMSYCYPADNAASQYCRKEMIQCIETEGKKHGEYAAAYICVKKGAGML